MTFRVIKPFLVGSIAIVHESSGTMLIVKENELEALAQIIAERINGGKWLDPQFYTEEQRALWRGHAEYIENAITGERVAPAMMENADELQTEKAEER